MSSVINTGVISEQIREADVDFNFFALTTSSEALLQVLHLRGQFAIYGLKLLLILGQSLPLFLKLLDLRLVPDQLLLDLQTFLDILLK